MNKDQVKKETLALLSEVKRPGIDKFVSYLEHSVYFDAPGSTKYHGAFIGGLAEHQLKQFKLFDKMCNVFKINFSRESRIVCSFGHDTCKIGAYSGDTKPFKYNKGQPRGHAFISLSRIKLYLHLTPEEEAVIKYHMGMYGTHEGNCNNVDYPIEALINAFSTYKTAKLFHYCDDMSATFLEE